MRSPVPAPDRPAGRTRRHALAAGAAAATALVLAAHPAPAAAEPGSATFTAPGRPQPFEVPADVCELHAVLDGAGGGRASFEGAVDSAGYGARVRGDLAVVPGQVLWITPGGKGGDTAWQQIGYEGGLDPDPSPGPGGGPTPWQVVPGGQGGLNGGGDGGEAGGRYPFLTNAGGGAGGGGASDLRTSPSPADRILVAGGGGGSGIGVLPPLNTSTDYQGSHGGAPALPGASQVPGGGGGAGTPTAGGAGGPGGPVPATSGTDTTGGRGGGTEEPGDPDTEAVAFGGGGGGGGWYAGGGGAPWIPPTGDGVSAGGGGGQSYAAPAVASVVHETGVREGDGEVELTWDTDPGCDLAVPAVAARPALAVAAAALCGGALHLVLVRRRRRVAA